METAYHSELLLGQVPALDQACFQIQRHVADPNFRGTHLCRVLGFGRLAIFQTCGFSALLVARRLHVHRRSWHRFIGLVDCWPMLAMAMTFTVPLQVILTFKVHFLPESKNLVMKLITIQLL